MYPVSNYYKEALREPVHKIHMYGTLGNVSFDEDDFSSLTISKSCSDANQISIGSVYMGELHITFTSNLGIAWDYANGMEISLVESLEIKGFLDEESVNGGTFIISETNYTKDGIEVVAYDAMCKFDKKIRAGAVSTKNRTLPDMIEDICAECNVVLGVEDFSEFPNYTGIFSLASENDCETYRDLLSWIAQTLCAFAIVNADNELILRMWKDSGIEDDTIDADNRSEDYSFSTFQTFYTGLSAVDEVRQKTHYYNVEPDIGLTYNLGTNPFLQTLSEDRFDAACENILNGLQNIYYTPFRIQILPTLAYQLGDILCFTGGRSFDIVGSLMSFDYTFNQSITMEGLGQDPALASAKSKTDKNLSGILKKTQENKEYLYQFYNDEDVVLDANWQTVFSQRFATVAEGYAIFEAEILADDPTGSVVEIRYLLDGEEVSRYPIETWIEGKHILSLFYPIQTTENEAYLWQVQLRANGAVEIPEHYGLGTIRGQGLASTHAWNGYIDVSDTYELLAASDDSELLTFTDSATITELVPISESISESYELLDSVDDSEMVHFLDVYAFDKEFHNRLTWDESAEMNWDASEAFYVWGLDIE